MQNSFLPQGTFIWQGLENWGCHNLGGMGTTSIQCIEASDSAKHLKIHRTTFHKKKIFRAQMLTVPSLRNFSVCDSIESSTVWSACSCLILVGVETRQRSLKLTSQPCISLNCLLTLGIFLGFLLLSGQLDFHRRFFSLV